MNKTKDNTILEFLDYPSFEFFFETNINLRFLIKEKRRIKTSINPCTAGFLGKMTKTKTAITFDPELGLG